MTKCEGFKHKPVFTHRLPLDFYIKLLKVVGISTCNIYICMIILEKRTKLQNIKTGDQYKRFLRHFPMTCDLKRF